MHRPIIIPIWFGLIFITIVFLAYLVYFMSKPKLTLSQNFDPKLYSSVPTQIQSDEEIYKSDGRTKLLGDFFGKGSALKDYSEVFVTVADKYQIDYRLMPAMAMQETTGGRDGVEEQHNPFNFRGHEGKLYKFASWEEGIEALGKELKEGYIDQGLVTPYQIMTKYTPKSLLDGGSWAMKIERYMKTIK